MMSGPSEKAIEAGEKALDNKGYRSEMPWFVGEEVVPLALAGAHDPALGLDRSVCLRELIGWLRDRDSVGQEWISATTGVAELIEEKFGGLDTLNQNVKSSE